MGVAGQEVGGELTARGIDDGVGGREALPTADLRRRVAEAGPI